MRRERRRAARDLSIAYRFRTRSSSDMSTTQQAGDGASQVEQEKPPRAPQQSRTHDLRNQLPARDYAVPRRDF